MAEQATCRVCGAAMVHGNCPACQWRAKKYAHVMAPARTHCECGAPLRMKRPGSTRLPKYCEPCRKLRALEGVRARKAEAEKPAAKGSRRG